MPDKQGKTLDELEVSQRPDEVLEQIISHQKKLILMEADLKQKCDAHDEKCVDLQNREEKLAKREKAYEKKYGVLSDSENFGEMVKLIDQVYTLYVSTHSSDKGLYDAIKLLLDARERYNTKVD